VFLTDAQIDLDITAAQSASQSSNLHVWTIVAVRDDDLRLLHFSA